jgi:hypothetical protein
MKDVKFKKFEPLSNHATITVKDFLKRGGSVITEQKTYIEIQRLTSIAKIDQHGRVEWRSM